MIRRLVYTALFGGNERLCEQPTAVGSSIEFVCVTDDPNLTSKTWRIVVAAPRFPNDHIRSARYLKVMGPPASFGAFDETLWIDNRVVLKEAPLGLFERMLRSADFALPFHDYNNAVSDEFTAVLQRGYDDPRRVREQAAHYGLSQPSSLQERAYWTAILFRRTTPLVEATMRHWMDDILRYSRRDQLSIRAAVDRTGIEPLGLDIVNRESIWHVWRTREQVGRNERSTSWARSGFRYPLVARVSDFLRGLQLIDRAKRAAKGVIRKG